MKRTFAIIVAIAVALAVSEGHAQTKHLHTAQTVSFLKITYGF